MTTSRPFLAAVLVVVLSLVLASSACDTLPFAPAERAAAVDLSADRIEGLEQLEREVLESPDAPDGLHAQVVERLLEAREQGEQLQQLFARMDQAEAETKVVTDSIGAAVGLTPLPAWGATLLSLVGGALGTWAAVGKDVRVGRQLVRAIDQAKGEDAKLAEALKAARTSIRAGLDLAVAKRIDELRL